MRMKHLARSLEVRADPVVLLRVGQEEKPIVAVRELREAGRDPDQCLLHPAETAPAETSVYADAHLLAIP
jgi:hypothetical protein